MPRRGGLRRRWRIASGCRDKTIKVWDVLRSLKASRWLGRAFQEIDTSVPVSKLRFSTDGTYLTTDVGLLKVGTIAAERYTYKVDSSHFLHVRDQ